jgi:hypothetical protein
MSFLVVNEPSLKQATSIFDVFLLFYIYCKQREGKILDKLTKEPKSFGKFQKIIYKFLATKMRGSPALQVQGTINDESIKNYFIEGINGEKKDQFILASLFTIDSLYKSQEEMGTPVLNRNFIDLGKVYYINGTSFGVPKGRELIRGLGTVGDRIENSLTNITVVTKIQTDYDVEFVKLPAFMYHLLTKDSLRIALVPFRKDDDPPSIAIKKRRDGRRYFRVKQVKEPERLKRLKTIIHGLAKAEVDIVVFPELTFSESLLDHLKLILGQEFLKNPENPTIKLVVTGSMHRDRRNMCFILGPDGSELLCQTKMNRFVLLPGEFEGIEEELVEDIDISERVYYLVDCPFGRVATMICLDFIVPETYAMLSSLKVKYFFLPSMTTSAKRFETNAFYHSCASGATTFFSNAYNYNLAGVADSERASFVFRPLKPTPKSACSACLERDPKDFETVLLFDSKEYETQSIILTG